MNMTIPDVLVRIAVAVIGGAGLVAFSMLRRTAKVPALAGLFVGIAAVFVSGQSVLTSGTATFSAIAFLVSQWVPRWRQTIYQSFFAVFKIIWLGIGANAIFNIGAVFWGWGGLNIGAPSWFFAEAIFAVIILNGVYIGKALGPGIATVIKTGAAPDDTLVKKIAASGSVSIVSWYSWLLARKGFLELSSAADLFATWLGMVFVVFGLTIILETLRRTIHARAVLRT
jgi:hypothetical protein